MRFSRCPLWLLTVICVAGFGLGGQPLFAQNSLPQDVLGATNIPTSEQQATVDAFIDTQVGRLKNTDPQQVAQGRSLLIEQFGLSTSPYFLKYYAQAVAQRVVPLLVPNTPLMTRLNVAIISAKLSNENLIKILQAGADDPSPAVRYWIAKSVGAAVKAGNLTLNEQRDALDILSDRLQLEDAALVLEQVMLAMAEIQLPEAIRKILDGLDTRVAFHTKNPAARYKAVHGGMQQLWRKLIELRSRNENVDREFYDLARIAVRYYALAARQLNQDAKEQEDDKDEDAEEAESDKLQMVFLCRRVMDYAVKTVAELNVITPSSSPITTKDWKALRVSVDAWREILKDSPFNFTDDQLAIDNNN